MYPKTSSLAKTFPDGRIRESISHGSELYLYTKSGRSYLDFTSGITAHSILGYSNEAVIHAITEQAGRICHVDYKTFSDGVREELADLILSKAEHSLDCFYLVGSSGAEACEASMKLSYSYHLACGLPSKKYFISRRQSYHGSTSDALSLGDRPNLSFLEPFHPSYRIQISEHNYLRHQRNGESEEEYAVRCAQELKASILDVGPENVSAFVAETTMGGLVGDVVPHPSYWGLIRDVCDEFNVHLILDEVWCGTGTSGKIYSIDWDGVTPDFIFMGKTLGAGYAAVSGLVTRKKFIDKIHSHFQMIPHSTTHQGHTLGCATALAVQKIIHDDSLLASVVDNGNLFKKIISDRLCCSPHFVEVRGRGLRISIEYNLPDNHWFGTTVAGIMRDKYGILVSGKWHRISFSPALLASREQIMMVAECICNVFLEVAGNLAYYRTHVKQNEVYF